MVLVIKKKEEKKNSHHKNHGTKKNVIIVQTIDRSFRFEALDEIDGYKAPLRKKSS